MFGVPGSGQRSSESSEGPKKYGDEVYNLAGVAIADRFRKRQPQFSRSLDTFLWHVHAVVSADCPGVRKIKKTKRCGPLTPFKTTPKPGPTKTLPVLTARSTPPLYRGRDVRIGSHHGVVVGVRRERASRTNNICARSFDARQCRTHTRGQFPVLHGNMENSAILWDMLVLPVNIKCEDYFLKVSGSF